MTMQARSLLRPTAVAFVAAHRVVCEVAAGRPIIMRDGADSRLASPLDGGPVISDDVVIAAPRAAYLGLGEGVRVVNARGAGRERLEALAMADSVDPEGLTVTDGGAFAKAAVELAKLAERLPAMMVAPAHKAPAGTLSAEVGDILAFRHALAVSQRPVATARVPLAAGAIADVTAFRNAIGGCVSAVAVGPLKAGALVRVHSSCVTGDILGSLKCDCGAQLRIALQRISEEGGLLLYTAQEGRGIGLVNKLRAYALQDKGLDTVDANEALGYHDDERDYAAAAVILRHLGLTDFRLLTNNPAKATALAASGFQVAATPLRGPITAENARYIETKRHRSGHSL